MTRLVAVLALALLTGCIPLKAYVMKGRAPVSELGIPEYDRASARVDSLRGELAK